MRRPTAILATVLGSLALGAAFLAGAVTGTIAGAADTTTSQVVSARLNDTPWGLMRDTLADTPWGLMRDTLTDTPWGFRHAGTDDTPWG